MRKLLSIGDNLSEYMNITMEKEVERISFSGSLPLAYAMRPLAQHILTLAGVELNDGLVMIATNRKHHWVMNRTRIGRDDVVRVFGTKTGERLWAEDVELMIYAETLRIYNPWRETNRHLPLCCIRRQSLTNFTLTELSCNSDEAAGIIHELVSSNWLSPKESIYIQTLVNEVAVKKNEPAPKPTKVETRLERPIPDWFRHYA
ncbi:hypothetical protein IJJ37_02655 [Candidatus Saccharibacteria bacterium]|nr:hypothetical protein [Candidatus Saccharibacteria bacterium]